MLPSLRFTTNLIRNLPVLYGITSNFHLFANHTKIVQKSLLSPPIVNLLPNCGFKVRAKLKKRCKDCFMVRREERWYVLCKTHPRHKQMQVVPDKETTWILSHATQSKIRPW